MKNHIILPMHLYAKLKDAKIVSEKYAPNNRAYGVDSDGNVHHFDYIGMNITLFDEDEATEKHEEP